MRVVLGGSCPTYATHFPAYANRFPTYAFHFSKYVNHVPSYEIGYPLTEIEFPFYETIPTNETEGHGTHREILLNQTEIRLYLPFSD